MAELPTGTVTFVFTDIEGSTQMVQRLGVGFSDLIDDHNRIVRRALSDGIEIRSEGDAFFFVFDDPVAAVRGVVALQAELATHEWPPGGEVRVRIGLHAGEGTLGGDDYIGIDVHRAARIAASGHGGQIVASSSVHALTHTRTGTEITFRDLGMHRFKGLDGPEHLFQVSSVLAMDEFPPIRSLDSRSDNFPSFTSEFIGREQELAQLGKLLEHSRLVTITGPGGAGKTRLALEAAARALPAFPDGATFVPLDTVSDASRVDQMVMATLGAAPQPGESELDAVVLQLRDRKALLVLDNFEHVLAAASSIRRILADASQVSILVTSQALLRLAGEQAFPLSPMAATGRAGDAVALFVDRMRLGDPGYEPSDADLALIRTIAERLNGLPLSIELAAARVRVLGLEGLLARLDDQLDLLRGTTGDTPARHQTLRGAIQWSYSLLSQDEQQCLQAISMFDGSFALDAAEAVTLGGDALELLESLLDKSLVQRSVTKGETRFRLLDSIRRYAREALEASEDRAEVSLRIADYYAGLAAEARTELEGGSQGLWLARYALEHETLVGVAKRAIAAGTPNPGLMALGPAWRFFHRRGHLNEGIGLLRELLTIPGASDRARAEGLNGLAALRYWQGEYEETMDLYLEALGIFEDLGDQLRMAETFFGLSTTAAFLRQYDAADRYADDARAAYEAAGRVEEQRRVTAAQAFGTWQRGDLELAAELWARAAELYDRVGDQAERLQTEVARAAIVHQLGDTPAAVAQLDDALSGMVEAEDVAGTVMVMDFMGAIGSHLAPTEGMTVAGASNRLRGDLGGGLTPEACGLPSAREVAGEAPELQQAWSAGQKLDFAAAIESAHRLAERILAVSKSAGP